jgi:hypothetical protein
MSNRTEGASLQNLGLEVEAFPQFLDSSDISPRIERYIFFPGDILGSRRKQEMRELIGLGLTWDGKPFRVLQNGGEEYQSPSLARTKGFVPRAFITPLEIAAYWVLPELLPEGAQTFRGVVNQVSPVIGQHVAGPRSSLVGEQILPGHAVQWILSAASNDQGYRRGVVELTSLRGAKWDDGHAEEIQRLYFPTYPELPVVLSRLEDQIRSVVRHQSGDIREIGEQMLNGCDEFRVWGMARLQDEFTLVQTGTTKDGYTYRYSELARGLMEQLEITPQDQQLTQVGRLQEQIGRSVQQLADVKGADQSQIIEALLSNQAQIAQALQAIAGRLPAQETPAPTPEPAAITPKTEKKKDS